jgi:hypothetical protein
MQAFVRDILEREQGVVEQACEASLQGGLFGVLVLTDPVTQRLVSAEVSIEVPYGAIYYRTKKEL